MIDEIRIYQGIFDRVAKLLEREYQVTADELRGQSRKRFYVGPRHVGMWLVRQIGRTHNPGSRRNDAYSFPRVARMFGRSDHTSAMHGCWAVERERDNSPSFRERSDAWVLEVRVQEVAPKLDALTMGLRAALNPDHAVTQELVAHYAEAAE